MHKEITETLKHKLRLETNRVRELESLVSALRTHEHQAVVESGDSSQRSELLRERVSALQEQNHGLSRQLEALKQDRKSFETEVERLRNVIEDAGCWWIDSEPVRSHGDERFGSRGSASKRERARSREAHRIIAASCKRNAQLLKYSVREG